jgi:hypothetical protein
MFARKTNRATTAASIDRTSVREAVVAALADIRGCDVADIEAEAAGGDALMDSKEAEVIISRLEVAFGSGAELVSSADLRPDQLTSVETLTSLLHDALQNRT